MHVTTDAAIRLRAHQHVHCGAQRSEQYIGLCISSVQNQHRGFCWRKAKSLLGSRGDKHRCVQRVSWRATSGAVEGAVTGAAASAAAVRLKVLRNHFDVSQGSFSKTVEDPQSRRRVQLAQSRVFK